jgi:hypothetical protein
VILVVFEFAEAENVLRLTLTGEMTDQAVLELWTKGLPIASSRAHASSIVDLSGVTRFNVSRRAIETLAKRQGPDLPSRIFIAPNDVLYGTARMFQMLSETTRKNVHVVRTAQDAYNLLGIEPPQFAPLSTLELDNK